MGRMCEKMKLKKRWCAALLTLAFLCLAAPGTAATRYYVKTDGDDTHDGSSWAAAKKNLAQVMANATSGDEIWVAKGTSSPGDLEGLSFDVLIAWDWCYNVKARKQGVRAWSGGGGRRDGQQE